MKFKTVIAILILAIVKGLCQTTPIYVNERDFVGDTPPQVDARAFVNQALFNITTTPYPFETQNTLYFTNKGSGTMYGSVGFRFDYYYPSNEMRLPAETFVNHGTITGDPYLIISATNILSPGLLLSGNSGMVHIDGSNINLNRSGVRTGEQQGGLISYDGYGRNQNESRSYQNAPGVMDYYWGTGTNNSLGTNGSPIRFGDSNAVWNFGAPYTISPQHEVRNVVNGRLTTNVVQLPQFAQQYYSYVDYPYGGYYYYNYGNYTAAAFTNISSKGDKYVSVVFYQTNNITTNFSTTVQFYSYDGPAIAIVGFSMTDYDIVLQSNILNYVYLIDSSAAATNHILYRSYNTNTYRPNVFELTRSIPYEAMYAVPTNTPFTNTLLYTPNYETNVVDIFYAGYAALIDQAVTNIYSPLIVNSYGYVVANPALSDPTNSVGRVEIEADDLNLIQTRIRAERFLGIKAKNIVSNRLAQVDAPVINYDIGTTNRVLELSNIVKSTVNRLSGTVAAYSAVWTNRYYETNLVGTNATVTTNTTHFHVLIVDNALTAAKSVILNELAVRATNLVVYDNLMVSKSAYFEGEGLRIARSSTGIGGLNLPLNQDWSSASFPRLNSLTNEGNLVISGTGNLYSYVQWGITNIYYPYLVTYTNAVFPYNNIINSGSVLGTTFNIKTTNLVNSGNWVASQGVISVEANDCVINGGQISSKSDLSLMIRNMALSNAVIAAGQNGRGALVLNITNTIDDGGVNATNFISVNDGLIIGSKPLVGDLRNTIIESKAERFTEVSHTFSSRNLGLTAAGYTNNMAIGALVLDAADISRIVLKGSGTNDAVYVDYLEFKNYATNYNSTIYIDTNLTIYFANANLSVNKLNGAFGGRIRWMPGFIGKFSTSYVTNSNGIVSAYNSAVIGNPDLDSDRDEIPNMFDPTPVPSDSSFNLQVLPFIDQLKTVVLWDALSRSTNRLDVTTNIVNGQWQTLTNFVNTGTTTRVTYTDVLSNSAPRYYRLRVDMILP